MSTITELRLQLLANGFSPLPNVDKICVLKGWPRIDIDADTVRRWGRIPKFVGTGLRLGDGLVAIDMDVNNDIIYDIMEALQAEFPALSNALMRKGGGVKEAWFVRCPVVFDRVHCSKWLAPGTTKEDGTHSVEIYSGKSGRQFGAFGPHSHNEDGSVAVEYRWVDDVSPENTRLDELPEFSEADLTAMRDIAETILRNGKGWKHVAKTSAGQSEHRSVYDLNERMNFHCKDGTTRKGREQLLHAAPMRCSASWLEGPTANGTSRCIINVTETGVPFVWETADDVKHFFEEDKPTKKVATPEQIAEMMQRLHESGMQSGLVAGADVQTNVAAITSLYAHCPTQSACVVPIYNPMGSMNMDAFKVHVDKYGTASKNGWINPATIWTKQPEMITIESVQMRPDMDRPLFEDVKGRLHANSYEPPERLEETGSPDVGVEFFEHLLPDPVERDWFTRWLAYKYQYPVSRGPGVLMVAEQQGAGRTTFFKLMPRLFGEAYYAKMEYMDIMGNNNQATYNEWMADSLIVCVDESLDPNAGASDFQSRRAAGERWKQLINPSSDGGDVTHIKRKGVGNGKRHVFTSFIIATNHRDAIPLEEGERRFAVLSNGEPDRGGTKIVGRFVEWMKDDANIEAFARYLEAYDLRGYKSTDDPIDTDAKNDMVANAQSFLDEAFTEVLEVLPGELITMEQLETGLRKWRVDTGNELPERWQVALAKVLVPRRLYRIGVKKGANWQPLLGGKRRAVYTTKKNRKAFWSDATPQQIANEVDKAGRLGGNVIDMVKTVSR